MHVLEHLREGRLVWHFRFRAIRLFPAERFYVLTTSAVVTDFALELNVTEISELGFLSRSLSNRASGLQYFRTT